MISEIDFTDIKESKNFQYATKLDFFKNNTKLEFTPGLNIIFAPNGSGKSTLLKIMAQFTASEQGGISTVTDSWLREVNGYKEPNLKGLSVKHDGQPVMYNNPRQAVGLIGGMAGFDDDFFLQGLQETQLKESTGLTTVHRILPVLSVLMGKGVFADEIKNKVKSNEYAKELLSASISKGQKTILLDEPESGLALQLQANLWKTFQAKQQDFQLIVATHSPFSLTCEANFIELQPGYIDAAKKLIKSTAQTIELIDKVKKTNKP